MQCIVIASIILHDTYSQLLCLLFKPHRHDIIWDDDCPNVQFTHVCFLFEKFYGYATSFAS